MIGDVIVSILTAAGTLIGLAVVCFVCGVIAGMVLMVMLARRADTRFRQQHAAAAPEPTPATTRPPLRARA